MRGASLQWLAKIAGYGIGVPKRKCPPAVQWLRGSLEPSSIQMP
jgi:hypothetical protein